MRQSCSRREKVSSSWVSCIQCNVICYHSVCATGYGQFDNDDTENGASLYRPTVKALTACKVAIFSVIIVELSISSGTDTVITNVTLYTRYPATADFLSPAAALPHMLSSMPVQKTLDIIGGFAGFFTIIHIYTHSHCRSHCIFWLPHFGRLCTFLFFFSLRTFTILHRQNILSF